MTLDRTLAPPLLDFVSTTGILPEVSKTTSGARLHLYRNFVQPVVRVELVFRAGKWYQAKAGVASLTAKMLKEGTAQRSAKQIADLIDFYGASLEVSHGFDRTTLSLYCLSKFLPLLLPLAFELVQTPSFPEKEFHLVKQRSVQSLAVDKQKNAYLATELLTTSIYGEGHPYATTIQEADINEIALPDLVQFHQQYNELSRAEVFATGAVDEETQQLLLSFLNKSAQRSATDIQTPSSPNNQIAPIQIKAESQNKMQAALRLGKPIIPPTHPDYPAFFLLNHALGGYFGSRLMKNIREDKGYTYGIHSSISLKEHGSLLTIGTDIKGDKIDETLLEISHELERLRNEGIPKDELMTVKKHLAGKFISDHSTIFDMMDRYKSTVLLNLPPDFFVSLQARIQAVTHEEILSSANEHLQDDTLFKISVGGTFH